jgi:excisionase family DNA binding protein
MPKFPGPSGDDGRPPKRWLTVKQLADRWQVSERTIHRMIKNQQISVKRIGRAIRIHPDVAE